MSPDKYLKRFRMIVDYLDKPKTTTEVRSFLFDRGVEMSTRSVQRYLTALYDEGVVEQSVSDKVRNGYEWSARPIPFYLNRDLMFEMALVLMIARDQLENVVTPAIFSKVEPTFDHAAQTVDEEGRQLYANWPQKVRVQPFSYELNKPPVEMELLEQVVQAVMREEVVSFTTYSVDTHKDPYSVKCRAVGFFYRGNIPYLVGLVPSGNETGAAPQHFPLARIQDFKETLDLDGIPSGFDFAAYASEGNLGFPLNRFHIPDLSSTMVFKAEVFVSVAREIHAASLGDDQVLEPIEGKENYFNLTVTVPANLAFAQWVIARSPYLKVKGPELFRLYIERELRQAIGHLDNPDWQVPPREAISAPGNK